MTIPSQVELLLCFNGDSSQLALSIPLAQCATFAVRPLKWLRFLGFVIYGRQGYLSTSMKGPEILDYTAQIEARPYYFISDGEPRLADVDALDDRTSSASDYSVGTVGFMQKVIKRDGTCVLTGGPAFHCDACHFIPHSKGDNYMSNLFNHRREAYSPVDPLVDVNDIRNGILLYTGFHHSLDAGHIAFLKTPNFALSVDDIPYHQPPSAGSPANRFTLQYIQPLSPDFDPMLSRFGPHNSDARQPQDVSQWPPAIVVDLCYATAVLRAWGPKGFIEYMRANSKGCYYGSGVEGHDDGPGDLTRQGSRQNQQTAHSIPYNRRGADKAQVIDPADKPSFEEMFDLVLGLWGREGEGRLPGSDAADVADNENKI